jgi:hypothetical protein
MVHKGTTGGDRYLPRIWAACVLAWLMPGAGHLFLRKYWHAAVYFLTVTGLLAAGIFMSGEMHSLLRSNAGEGFLQLMAAIGNVALGALHAVFLIFGIAPGGLEAIRQRSYEYGTTFIVIAALINLLAILDAFDHARGVKE